jgi:cytochrome o ubiquinol oxidase subunit 2
MADSDGTYRGSSANISGEGFAGMIFNAKSVSQDEFGKWAASTLKSSPPLDMDGYDKLAAPSKNNPPEYFRLAQADLYNQVVAKYMPYHEHGGVE